MRPVGIVLLVLLIAGCASKANPESTPTQTFESSAAPVVTTSMGGAVHGFITDDEAVPLPGASVGLVKTNFKTTSAANGEFTLNEVPAGDYALSVNALGFVTAAKRVQVRDGEATEVKISLTPIPISKDLYVEHYHGAFYIQFDWFGVAQLTAVHGYLCTPCDVYQSITPGATGAFLETTWLKSVPAPSFSDTILVSLYTKPANDTFVDGQTVISKAFQNRQGFGAAEAGIQLLKKAGITNTQVLSPGLTQIAFQQKVETWLSVSYNAPMPENYTALPPA